MAIVRLPPPALFEWEFRPPYCRPPQTGRTAQLRACQLQEGPPFSPRTPVMKRPCKICDTQLGPHHVSDGQQLKILRNIILFITRKKESSANFDVFPHWIDQSSHISKLVWLSLSLSDSQWVWWIIWHSGLMLFLCLLLKISSTDYPNFVKTKELPEILGNSKAGL